MLAATDVFAQRATLSRSVRLLSQFRFEQSDPSRFYKLLAEDTAAMVGDLWLFTVSPPPARHCSTSVRPRLYFATAFPRRRIHLHRRRTRPAEMHAGPATGGSATYVRASGMALPFADANVDICLSSNVAEHVPEPWRLARRCCGSPDPVGSWCSPTPWLGPFGGHEMGLTHYLRVPVRPTATPANMATGPRMTARRCSRCPPRPGSGGLQALALWSPHFPVSTHDGPGG